MLEQDLDVVARGDVSRNGDNVKAGFGFTDDDAEFVVDEDDKLDRNSDEGCTRVWADAAFGGNPDGAARCLHADSGFGNRCLPGRPSSCDVTRERAQLVGVDRNRVDGQPDVTLQTGGYQREFVVLGTQHGATGVVTVHCCGPTAVRSLGHLAIGRIRHRGQSSPCALVKLG